MKTEPAIHSSHLLLQLCLYVQVLMNARVNFSRCCSQTLSAPTPSSRTITWWLSCKNVSPTQNSNWEQPCAFFTAYSTKDLHVLQNSPTKPYIPTLKHPAASHFHTVLVFFFFYNLYVIQSYTTTWSRQMRMLWFVFNKWKAACFVNSRLNSFQTLPRTMMPTSRRSPRRSWRTEPTSALTLLKERIELNILWW